jgi:hypothetical protein
MLGWQNSLSYSVLLFGITRDFWLRLAFELRGLMFREVWDLMLEIQIYSR